MLFDNIKTPDRYAGLTAAVTAAAIAVTQHNPAWSPPKFDPLADLLVQTVNHAILKPEWQPYIVDAFDTVNHQFSVATLSLAVAQRLGLDLSGQQRVYYGALYHDIGKFALDPRLLFLPRHVTPDEYEIIKRHPGFSHDIIMKGYAGPEKRVVAGIALHHHVRLGGNGYPSDLKGQEIPLEVRIVGAVDVFDAKRRPRPHDPECPPEKAMDILMRERGVKFDEKVVNVLRETIFGDAPRMPTSLPSAYPQRIKTARYGPYSLKL